MNEFMQQQQQQASFAQVSGKSCPNPALQLKPYNEHYTC